MDAVKLTELIIKGIVDLSYVVLASYIATLTSHWLIHRLDVLGPGSVVFQRREPMSPDEEAAQDAPLSEPIHGTVDATNEPMPFMEKNDQTGKKFDFPRFRRSKT